MKSQSYLQPALREPLQRSVKMSLTPPELTCSHCLQLVFKPDWKLVPNEKKTDKHWEQGFPGWPLFLVDRLLPHGHVLGVLLQPVEGRIWLHPDAVVMILGVASDGHSERKTKNQCNHCYYPFLPAALQGVKGIIALVTSTTDTELLLFAVTSHLPGAEAAGPQAHEDGADEFPKGGGVDRIQFLLLTVPQVMVIEWAPGQAHSLRRLVVVQQPLQLKIYRKKQNANSQAQETDSSLFVQGSKEYFNILKDRYHTPNKLQSTAFILWFNSGLYFMTCGSQARQD